MTQNIPSQDEYQEEFSNKSFWQKNRNVILFLIGMGAIWLFFRGKRGFTTIDNSDLFITFMIGMLFLQKSTIWYFKYLSPKVIWNGGFSTYDGNIYKHGHYNLIRLGGFKVGSDPTAGGLGAFGKGSDATIIFPRRAKITMGESVSLTITPFIYMKEDLPRDTREMLISRKFPEPFLFGVADQRMFMQNPDLSFLVQEYRLQCRYAYELEQQIKEVMDFREKKKGWSNRMAGIIFRGKDDV